MDFGILSGVSTEVKLNPLSANATKWPNTLTFFGLVLRVNTDINLLTQVKGVFRTLSAM